MADNFDPTSAPAYQEGAALSGTPIRTTPVRGAVALTLQQPGTAPAQKENGLKFGWATLILLGFVSWGAQFVAASTFGIAEYFNWGVRSTGGLVALIAGIVMWVKCRSWESWRKWIWLPILITVTMAFINMGFTEQSIAREEAEIRQEQELRQEEEARQAEIAQACQGLVQQIEVKATEVKDLQPRTEYAYDPGAPSWMDGIDDGVPPDWHAGDRRAAEEEYGQLRAEYDASC